MRLACAPLFASLPIACASDTTSAELDSIAARILACGSFTQIASQSCKSA